jgi:hypothetical protein
VFGDLSIATGYGLDDQGVGVRVPVGPRIFSSLRRTDQLWGHPASYPMDTTEKRPRPEADHSAPTSKRSRKHGSIHPLPHTSSWRSALVKHRNNFNFTLYPYYECCYRHRSRSHHFLKLTQQVRNRIQDRHKRRSLASFVFTTFQFYSVAHSKHFGRVMIQAITDKRYTDHMEPWKPILAAKMFAARSP